MISTSRTTALNVAFVFVCAVLLFRMSWPVTFSGDDLQYTMVIDRAVNGTVFYHPAGGQPYLTAEALAEQPASPAMPINIRYLLEWPTSILAATLWQRFGGTADVITPILALRTLVGALGLVFFFLALHRLLDDRPVALVCTLGLGLSASYWTYSTHMDQSINMAAVLMAALYVMVGQAKAGVSGRGMFVLAVLLALASFYNFTAALAVIPFGLTLAVLYPRVRQSTRFWRLVGFGLLYGIIAVLVIALSIVVLVSPESLTDPAFWSSALFSGKPEYGVNLLGDTLRAALGFAKSQIVFPPAPLALQEYWDSASRNELITLAAYFGVILLLMAIPMVFLYFRRRFLRHRQWYTVVLLAVWLIIHAVFNWFWDPGFIKYWLMPLACFWGMAAVALTHCRECLPRFYRPAFAAAALFAAASVAVNGAALFIPAADRSRNPWSGIAAELAQTEPNALFVSAGHPLDFYIAYFARRDILSTELIGYDRGNDAEAVAEVVNSHIADHRADAGAVYVYGIDDMTPEERRQFSQSLNISALTPAWTYPSLTIYEAELDG